MFKTLSNRILSKAASKKLVETLNKEGSSSSS
jgi:hypothetical protein